MKLKKEDIYNQIVKEYSLNSFEIAEKMSLEFLNKFPNDIRVLNILGALYVQREDFITALKYLLKTIDIKKDYYIGYNNIGLVYRSVGEHKTALDYFKRAIHYKNNYKEAFNNLGITYQSLNKIEDAQKALNKSIEIDNNYFQSYYNLGKIKSDKKEFSEAIKLYKNCHKLKHDYFPCLLNLGSTYLEIGKLENALIFLQKANKVEPNNHLVPLNIGNVYYKYGKINKALSYYKIALEKKPKDSDVLAQMAICYKELGNQGIAWSFLKESESASPDHLQTNFQIGLLYYENREDKKAIKYFEKSQIHDSNERVLVNYYRLKEFETFEKKIKEISKVIKDSRIIAALSNHYSYSFNRIDDYKFCPNPMRYIYKNNIKELTKEKNLKKKLIELINKNEIDNRKSGVVINGTQSSGNLLEIDNEYIKKLKNLIIKEIENYKILFKDEKSIFIEKFPKKTNFNNSWFVKLSKGGHLNPHYHHSGWMSGAVYLKIPTEKNNSNEGDFVVGMTGDNFPHIKDEYPEKVISIKTDDIVLFPSSLFHRTIPFQSDEERICIAFDIAPD